jgi:RND family efflux transporter MFP subunit
VVDRLRDRRRRRARARTDTPHHRRDPRDRWPRGAHHRHRARVLARIIPQVESTTDRVSLDAAVREARAELAAAESQLTRSERLWAERTISERQLEEARTRVTVARARTDAAQSRLGQFDVGASGRGGGRTPFQIRSPLAGTLITTEVSSGQSVEDGELLFTVVDLDRVWLHADVFEPDVAAVERATEASFRVDGYDQLFAIAPPDGRVVTIGQHVDEKTRTVPVIFELGNPGGRLRIGSFATVWIAIGAPVRALAVPETAIVDDAGRRVAYVQVGGEAFERRVLALGARSGGWVQVKAGLAAGEHVVTSGAYDIKLAAAGGAVPEHGHAH